MTRQEAIEDLKLLRFNHNVMINGTNHTSKALDMAIEALELIETKQQAIKTSDCISKQAAIDALDRIFDRCEEIEAHLPEDSPDRTGYKMYPDYTTVWKYLHQLPSAQPQKVCVAEIKVEIDDIKDYIDKAINAEQWIPVDERLPESNQCVLVSIKGEVDVDWITVDSTGYGCWYRCMKDVMSVDAWMPLPDPYGGEEHDD